MAPFSDGCLRSNLMQFKSLACKHARTNFPSNKSLVFLPGNRTIVVQAGERCHSHWTSVTSGINKIMRFFVFLQKEKPHSPNMQEWSSNTLELHQIWYMNALKDYGRINSGSLNIQDTAGEDWEF